MGLGFSLSHFNDYAASITTWSKIQFRISYGCMCMNKNRITYHWLLWLFLHGLSCCGWNLLNICLLLLLGLLSWLLCGNWSRNQVCLLLICGLLILSDSCCCSSTWCWLLNYRCRSRTCWCLLICWLFCSRWYYTTQIQCFSTSIACL